MPVQRVIRVSPEVVAANAGGDSQAEYILDRPPFTRYVWSGTQFSAPGAVSGGGSTTAVASSRASLAADSGATLELANGITYTLDSAVPLAAGVTLVGPATGSATLAVTGSATMNGGTTSITISAGQVYSAIPRASSASAYLVKGS